MCDFVVQFYKFKAKDIKLYPEISYYIRYRLKAIKMAILNSNLRFLLFVTAIANEINNIKQFKYKINKKSTKL